MASSKLTRFIFRLFRYLVSFAGRSIKGLITLIGWAQQYLARNRYKPFPGYSPAPSDNENTEAPSNTPSDVPHKGHLVLDVQHEAKPSKGPDHLPSHPPPESVMLRSGSEYVCPSYPPRAERLHDRGDDNGGPSTTRSASPLPSQPTSTPPHLPTLSPITASIGDSPPRSSSPANDLEIKPMSTHIVQRWDRDVAV